jgi:hypothetical protein
MSVIKRTSAASTLFDDMEIQIAAKSFLELQQQQQQQQQQQLVGKLLSCAVIITQRI